MTYKIKTSFIHPIFEHTGNPQGYSGTVGTTVSKENYEKIVADNKDLAKRFEQEGVIPNTLKTLEALKNEAMEIAKLIAKKEKEEEKTK